MSQLPITAAAAALCGSLISDPALDFGRKSLVKQFLAFVESVRADGKADPFYEECIKSLAVDIAGVAL